MLIAPQDKICAAYPSYIVNYDQAIARLKKIKKKSSKLVAFLEEQKNRPESRKLDLESLLIMPVQRYDIYVPTASDSSFCPLTCRAAFRATCCS